MTSFSCFCFKQKTAYEMRISDWSSDVCSSDLVCLARRNEDQALQAKLLGEQLQVDDMDLAPVGRSTQCRCDLGGNGRVFRLELQWLHVIPVHGQHRLDHRVHAQHVGPTDFQTVARSEEHKSELQ